MSTYSSQAKRSGLFPYLLILSFIFLIVQISVFVTANSNIDFLSLVQDNKVTAIPNSAYIPVLFLFLIQISLTILLAVVIWAITRLLGHLLHWRWENTCQIGFGLWMTAVFTIIVANQYFFPASTFSEFSQIILPHIFVLPFLLLSSAVLAIALLIALLSLIDLLTPKKLFWRSTIIATIFLGTIGFETTQHAYAHSQAHISNTNTRPNIIIIGIDSLRPDYTGFMGNQPDLTPNLDQFLQNATIFDNSITPLARTFPSWTAILTGLDPIHNKIRFNLAQQKTVSFPTSFAAALQKQGYFTLYATDDRRFSTITSQYGFDAIVSPKDGINDFIIGTINDLPFSNLIINTPIGKWIFPYNYANRASYETYHPETFDSMVEDRILTANSSQPALLIVHFCLPHWPYAWAKQEYEPSLFPEGLYKLAVKRSDEQIGHYIEFLQQHHYLDHAIVIVLSDHGEGLMLPSDRIIQNQNYIKSKNSDPNIFAAIAASMKIGNASFDSRYGHGTDVLTYSQYHNVLAFKTFGLKQAFTPGHINAPVSTIDINPTILNLLGLSAEKTDGVSLASILYHPALASSLNNRVRFTETGFTPNLTTHGTVQIADATFPSANLYLVNPSYTISFNPKMAQQVIPLKQRAVFYHDWILALYPHDYKHVTAIVVNKKTGRWTDDLQSNFAKQAPLNLLLSSLSLLYGPEVTGRYPFKA